MRNDLNDQLIPGVILGQNWLSEATFDFFFFFNIVLSKAV